MKSTTAIVRILSLALMMTALLGCTESSKKERALKKGNEHLAAGRLEKAEVEFKNAWQIPPPSFEAASGIGEIYLKQGKWRLAYAFLSEAGKLSPDNVDVKVQLGQVVLQFGMWSNANAQAVAALQKTPGHPKAMLLLAESAMGTNLNRCAQILEMMPEQAKSTAEFMAAKGILFIRARQADNAEKQFASALKVNPKLPEALLGMCNVYLLRGQLDKAEEVLRNAAAAAGPRDAIRLKHGALLLRKGPKGIGEARAIANEMIKESPDYVPGWMFLCSVALAENKVAEAAQALDKVLEVYPQHLEARISKADLLFQSGDITNAIATYERVLKESPAPEIYFKLARAQTANQEFAKAMITVSAVTNLPEASLLQSDLLIRDGRYAMALPTLQRLSKQLPQSPQPRWLMSKAYLGLGQFDSAAEELVHISNTYTNTPNLMIDTAATLLRLRRTNDAVVALDRAVGMAPTNASVLTKAAGNYAFVGRLSDARRHYSQALNYRPDNLEAIDGLAAVELSEGQFEKARGLFREKLDAFKDNAALHLLYARLEIKQAIRLLSQTQAGTRGQLKIRDFPAAAELCKDAEASLRRALQLKPDFFPADLELAGLYTMLGDREKAIASYTDALGKNVLPARDRYNALFSLALLYEATADFQKAKDAYERAIATEPNAFQAYNNLAVVYSKRLGDLDRALEAAENAQRLLREQAGSRRDVTPGAEASVEDTLAYILIQRGWKAAKREDLVRALALLNFANQKAPDEPELKYHLGLANYLLLNKQEAAASLNSALAASTVSLNTNEVKALAAVASTDPANSSPETVQSLEQRLKSIPNDPLASKLLGDIFVRNQDSGKAAAAYETSIKAVPNPGPMLELARLYAGPLNKAKDGLEMAKNARKSDPGNPDVARLLGHLLVKTGDAKSAIPPLEESIRSLRDAQSLRDLAWAYYQVGREGDSLTQMRDAFRANPPPLNPSECEAFIRFVEASQTPEKAVAVAADARKFLQTQPGFLPAAMVDAVATGQAGQFQQAATKYDGILASNPEFAPALKNLTILYAERLADPAKAYPIALRARDALPQDPMVAKILGVLCYERKDYARAVQFLTDAARGLPADAEVLYYRGMAHHQLRQTGQSKQFLISALKAPGLDPKLAAEANRVLKDAPK